MFGFERAYLSSTWENGLSYDNSNHWNLVILLQVESAVDAAKSIGYPVMVRAAYALGGLGSGLCEDEKKLREVASQVFLNSKFIDTLCSRQATCRISCKRQNLLKKNVH